MTKRYISFLLSLTILISCFAFSASASENNIGYIDLMKYGGVVYNDVLYGDFKFTPASNTSGYFEFPVGLPFPPGKIELVIFTGSNLKLYNSQAHTIELTKTTSLLPDRRNRYLVYSGDIGGIMQESDSFKIWFDYTTGSTAPEIRILSAKIVPYGYDTVQVPFTPQVFDTTDGTMLTSSTDIYRFDYADSAYYPDADNKYYRQIRIYPNKESIAGLDYIDIDMYFKNLEINSMSASFGGNALDVEYTSSIIGDGVMGDNLETGEDGSDKTYAVYKVVVRIDVSGVSLLEGEPCLYITYNANNFYGYQPYVYIYGINGGKYWLEPDAQLTYLGKIWNTLKSGFQSVVDAIKGDPSNKNEFQQEVENQAGELDDMAQIMDSVERPDIDDVSGDVSDIVSDNDVLLVTQPINALMGNEIIVRIVLLSLTFALVSYCLFGKK